MSVSVKLTKDTKRELPDCWRWAKLGEVKADEKFAIVDGPFGTQLHADEYVESGVPLIRVTNITKDGYSRNDLRYITEEKFKELSRSRIISGDILIAKTGATFGKACIYPQNEPEALITSSVAKVSPHKAIAIAEFLMHYINSAEGYKQIAAVSTRSAQPGFNLPGLMNIFVPLPPLAEQRRIVGVLREQMAAVDKARAAAQARLEVVKALPAAFLQQVFPQPGQPIPTGWRWVRLGEVCEIVRGSSPRPKGDPRYYGGTVPRLMVEDVTRDGMYVIPKVDFLTEEGATFSRPMKKGDVVIVVSGAPGMPAILNVDACIHDGFVGLRNLMTESIIQEYLFYLLVYLRESTDKQATGAIFRNLTTYQVGRIAVLLPPIIEQKRILAILREQMAAVEKTRAATEAELNTINALPAALLRRAFNGEI